MGGNCAGTHRALPPAWPGRSARRRHTAAPAQQPGARRTGWSRGSTPARPGRCPEPPARPAPIAPARSSAGLPGHPAGRRRHCRSSGAMPWRWRGRCPARGPCPGRCARDTTRPACRIARPPAAARGWAASPRPHQHGCARYRRRHGRSGSRSPRWRCPACCGARPASSACSPALRHGGRGRAHWRRLARACCLRRPGRGRAGRTGWSASP